MICQHHCANGRRVFCTDVMLYWNHHKEYARDKLDDRTATYPWDKVLRLE